MKSKEKLTGIQRLTIPEKAIQFTHLSYPIGCFVIAILAGGPGSFFVFYLGSFDLENAWHKTVSVSILSIVPVTQTVSISQGVVEVCVSTFALFVDLYLTRYLRLKVLVTEPKLSPMSPNGKVAYDRAFGLMSSIYGTVFFALVFFLVYFPARASIAGSLISLIGITVLSLITNMVYGVAFWVYLSCIWGVFRFGSEPLNLKRFYEDRMLGLRPLGQIVVSSAWIFSLAITTTLGASLIRGDITSTAINLVIVAVGVSMLFLPLFGIHEKMARVKEKEEASLNSRSKEMLEIMNTKDDKTENRQHPLWEIEQLLELQRFQALRAEMKEVSEWPFETRQVERLVAILLAIFTVLATRLLELLH